MPNTAPTSAPDITEEGAQAVVEVVRSGRVFRIPSADSVGTVEWRGQSWKEASGG